LKLKKGTANYSFAVSQVIYRCFATTCQLRNELKLDAFVGILYGNRNTLLKILFLSTVRRT